MQRSRVRITPVQAAGRLLKSQTSTGRVLRSKLSRLPNSHSWRTMLIWLCLNNEVQVLHVPRGGRLATRDQRSVVAALRPHTNKVVFHFGRVSRSQCPSCLVTRGSGLADYAVLLASSQLVRLDKPGDGRDRRQQTPGVGVDILTRFFCCKITSRLDLHSRSWCPVCCLGLIFSSFISF